MCALKNRSGSPLSVLVLALLVVVPVTFGQDELVMDGMGNINSDQVSANSPASALYESRCAQCHDNPVGRVPPRASLRYRPPEGVYQALLSGVMSPMTEGLEDHQIKSLVKLLTGREPKHIPDPNSHRCTAASGAVVVDDEDWVSVHGDIQGHRFRNSAAFNANSVNRLKLKWAYAYPGGAKGPVTAAGNTLFLAGTGYVVALNADSGCVKWSYPIHSRTVRTVTVAASGASDTDTDTQGNKLPSTIVLFGDDSSTVFALNASTGVELWQTNVESHVMSRITAAPTVHEGTVYIPISSLEDPLTHDENHFCCSGRGGIAAIALRTGELLWKKEHITQPLISLKPELQDHDLTGQELQSKESLGAEHGGGQFQQGPAGASTYTPLTIDVGRGLVYASTAEEYGFTGASGPYSVIAYDLKTGDRAWQQSLLPAKAERSRICSTRETDCRNFFSMGTSVVLHPLSEKKDVLVVGQKSGMVHALDPDNGGKLLWSTQVADGGDLGGIMYGLASDSKKIYVPVSDVDSPTGRFTGSLVALDPMSGDIVWRTNSPKPACNWERSNCIAGQVAAVTVVSDMVLTGFWDGYLRIYAASDGRLLREIDTAIEHPAVNGVATGGQVSGYPVTVAKDALYINSGASSIMKSGDALLVYTLDGK